MSLRAARRRWVLLRKECCRIERDFTVGSLPRLASASVQPHSNLSEVLTRRQLSLERQRVPFFPFSSPLVGSLDRACQDLRRQCSDAPSVRLALCCQRRMDEVGPEGETFHCNGHFEEADIVGINLLPDNDRCHARARWMPLLCSARKRSLAVRASFHSSLHIPNHTNRRSVS